MNEQMRRYAVGLLALGFTSSCTLVAAAQDIDDDSYIIDERYLTDEPDPPVTMFDDDEDDDGSDEVRVVYQGGIQRCADTFRSFNPDTGTYVTFQGETRVCPYLE